MKIPLNIPNILSLYRLFSFPIGLYWVFTGNEKAFVILLCVNLITDILDGWIARTFNMMTEIGARLDSIADIGTYILAFAGIIQFKSNDFNPHIISFSIFIGLFILSNLLSLLKFKRLPSLHLYSWKIGGYVQGIFFFILFAVGFKTPFYYVMVIWGILAFLEHIVVQLLLKEMKSNSKGLYWMLKARNLI
jgi:CDP-diacylglycerol--glycerol-3-phosphate 3-phosphatidyltransferase